MTQPDVPRPLHVLLGSSTRAATWTSTCLLAGALPLDRFRVTIVAIGPPLDAPKRAELLELAPRASLAILEGPSAREGEPWSGLEEVRQKLLLLLTRLQPSVVHMNVLALGATGWQGPVVVTPCFELTSWSRATGRQPAVDAARYRAQAKAALDAANVVTAASASLARDLERTYGLAESVRVIRMGVPAAQRASIDRGLAALACLDEDDSAGEALDWLLAIAGRLPGTTGIVGRTIARDLPKTIVPLGRLPRRDVLGLMAGTKIYLGLARYEPIGLAVAEAHSAGARLVLTDTAVHRELWSGRCELVRDAESLLHAFVRSHAAQRATRPPVPHYSIVETASAYGRLYEELVASSRALEGPQAAA